MERKTALVTGACVNTGYAIAQKFISENWNVVITGRSQERVDEAVKKLSAEKKDGFVLGYALAPFGYAIPSTIYFLRGRWQKKRTLAEEI